MGLMNFLNTAFESSVSNTTQVYSMLSTNGSANSIQNPNNTLTTTNAQQQTELYKFLYNYTFVQYIVGQIENAIKDIFSKSSLKVTVNRDAKKFEKYGTEANNLLSDLNFFSTIETDLYDLLYYGNYGYKVDFKDRRMKRLTDGFEVKTEDTYCTDRKLIIKNWEDKDERMKDKKYKYVLLPVQYQPKKYREYTEVDAYVEEEIRLHGHVDVATLRKNYLKDHPNADKVIKHTIYRGVGVLDGVMNDLLVLYAKELLYDLMGLKDTMRPDVLTARVMDDHTNETDIVSAINDIEALVNMGSASSTEPGVQSFLSIQNLVAGIQSYLQNGIKVVPEMNNFSSISNLNLPDLLGKRRQLKEEIDELRQRILKNVGLEDQPARNNWDAMQNNAKFLTTVQGIVSCISRFARDVIYEYLKVTYPKDDIKVDEIELDMDTTDIIFNQFALTRSRVLTEKVDSISRILRTIDDFATNQYVDQSKMTKYVMKLISDLDPTAENFIKDVPQTPPETPEESGGEYGEEPPAEGEGESMEGEGGEEELGSLDEELEG